MYNRRFGEITNHIFETYNNYLTPHGCHIHKMAPAMATTTMCTFPSAQHDLPHWKFVLHYCAKCPSIVIPSQ